MWSTTLHYTARMLLSSFVMALVMTGCYDSRNKFPDGTYVLTNERLRFTDAIHLHADLSWNRTVNYVERDGTPRGYSEGGTATLLKSSSTMRVLQFEPFTFAFEQLVPKDLTFLKNPSPTLNTTLLWRWTGKHWILELNSEFGYEYVYDMNRSGEPTRNEILAPLHKGDAPVSERVERIKRAIQGEKR